MQEFTKGVRCDFDRPASPVRVVAATAHSLTLSWDTFTERLDSLRVTLQPLGEEPPAGRVIELEEAELKLTSLRVDSLQDSRRYRCVLRAVDPYGNIGETVDTGYTESGEYTISGTVSGTFQGDTADVKLILYHKCPMGTPIDVDTVQPGVGTPYTFASVHNGQWYLRLEAPDHDGLPEEYPMLVKRSDTAGIDFTIRPELLFAPGAVRVAQADSTGDLLLFARTTELFDAEEPVAVRLRWQSVAGDTGLQVIEDFSWRTLHSSTEGAVWEITIPRAVIADSILSRTSSFDGHLRYVDAGIVTATQHFDRFRTGVFTYPEEGDGRELLFSPQWYGRPGTPAVSPMLGVREARLHVTNPAAGPGVRGVAALIRLDHNGVPLDTIWDRFTVSNTTLFDTVLNTAVRVLDRSYAVSSTFRSDGAQLVSGFGLDSLVRVCSNDGQRHSLFPGAGGDSAYTSWLVEVPADHEYHLWAYVSSLSATEAVLPVSFGDPDTAARVDLLFTKDGWLLTGFRGPGWYRAAKIPVEAGTKRLNVFLPDSGVSVGAVALTNNRFIAPPAYRLGAGAPFGTGGLSYRSAPIAVVPASHYQLRVHLVDRYGNTGDTVVIDSLQTLDDLHEGHVTVYQRPGDGGLVVSVSPPPTVLRAFYEVVDSVALHFGDRHVGKAVHVPLQPDAPAEVVLDRDDLEPLIGGEDFDKYARYIDAEMRLARIDSFIVPITEWGLALGGCDACTLAAGGGGRDSCLFNFSLGDHVITGCARSRDTLHVVRMPSDAIRFDWPNETGPEVASQEYRAVTEADIEVEAVGARHITLSCTNLNEDGTAGDGLKRQMAGTLNISWAPGSNCEDTSSREIPFRNTFTMADGWIAGVPSFEGATDATVGPWRPSFSDTMTQVLWSTGGRHRWVDHVDGGADHDGGGFYPNLGDTVSDERMALAPDSVPSISIGFSLSESEVSHDSGSAEQFVLWALPGHINGPGNQRFWWGLDGVPVPGGELDVECHDSTLEVWVEGPGVSITEPGFHTLDIFMKDDGLRLAGFALAKRGLSSPPFVRNDLSRWGEGGFDLTLTADNLAAAKRHVFHMRAVDRYGNAENLDSLAITTNADDQDIPDIVLTADVPLDNGYYPSQYPSFTAATRTATDMTLSLDTLLLRVQGETIDTVVGLRASAGAEENTWRLFVDSLNPLASFPPAGVFPAADTGYVLRARARTADGVGNWARVVFGVRPDPGSVPQTTLIEDPYYELPFLAFRYERGMERTDGTIVGNLEVLFDEEGFSAQRLMLEGAIIHTDTSMDTSGAVRHLSIVGISVDSTTRFAAYGHDILYGEVGAELRELVFRYGRYTARAVTDSMRLHEYTEGWKIAVDAMYLEDDKSAPARVYGALETQAAVPLTRMGIIDDFHSPEDLFYLRDVQTYGTRHPGFSLLSCITSFCRSGAEYTDYTVRTAGTCSDCGPYLDFTVKSPKYLDTEFEIHERLRDTVVVAFTDSDPDYAIQWNGGNPAVTDNHTIVDYRGWTMNLCEYTFTDSGVYVDRLNLYLPAEVFPDECNHGGAVIAGFKGGLIAGSTGLNDGALHLDATMRAAGKDRRFHTAGGYVFRDIPEVLFYPVNGNLDYELSMHACSLALPSWNTDVFNETDTLAVPAPTVRIGPNDITELAAGGDFRRTIGTFPQHDNGVDSAIIVDGLIEVGYAARDFQLSIRPTVVDADSTIPLMSMQGGFFEDRGAAFPIRNGSLSLFSDFTLNRLYATHDFGGQDVIKPEGFEYDLVALSCDGFDLVRVGTDTAEVRLLLLNPALAMFDGAGGSVAGDNDRPRIHNATVDPCKQLATLNGEIPVPEKLAELMAIPGWKGIKDDIDEKVATLNFDAVRLGYRREAGDTVLSVGARGSVIFGSVFKPLGLEGEAVLVDACDVGYHRMPAGKRGWRLDSLHARSFSLPRRFAITADDIMSTGRIKAITGSVGGEDSLAREKAKEYVVFYNGGKGLELDYGEERFELGLRDWSVRLTEDFPIPVLRNFSLLLDEMTYVKDRRRDKGYVESISARAEYVPPGGRLEIAGFGLRGVRIGLDCDKPDIDPTDTTIAAATREAKLNAYVSIAFDTIALGDRVLPSCDATTNVVKVYFDGRVSATLSIKLTKQIGIVPWMAEEDPEVYIDSGGCVTLSFSSDSAGVSAETKLCSARDLPLIDRPLDARITFKASLNWHTQSFELRHLEGEQPIHDTLIDNESILFAVDSIKVGYREGTHSVAGKTYRDVFSLLLKTRTAFKWKDACELGGNFAFGFAAGKKELSNTTKVGISAYGTPTLDCQLGGLRFGARFALHNDTLGFEYAYLDFDKLQAYGVLDVPEGEEKVRKDAIAGHKGFRLGVEIFGAYWVKGNDGWDFQKPRVEPTFVLKDRPFRILCLNVIGDVNFSRLFNARHPGIRYENIRIALPKQMGGAVIPTGMTLTLDGRKPFIHPEFDKPGEVTIRVPAIELNKNIKLAEALMSFGTAPAGTGGVPYEQWYFRGRASMALQSVGDLTVDVAFEKPHPWENITGIRHAIVTLMLADAMRIPIGTTPFYITGFMGALYDGVGQPKGVAACGIPPLDPGLKMETMVFIEFKRPEVARGSIGFWVQLNRLNFGINGTVEALQGVATADACAALYNNGSAFHGNFNITAHLGLSMQGLYVVDIWSDRSGPNFTASAESRIGLQRGSLVNRRCLKIPRKTRWFAGLFTNLGKFTNNQKGFTTGVHVLGKRYGVGVIARRFRVGNLGSYRLKRAPAALAKRPALAKTAATFDTEPLVQYDLINPHLGLQGGEVVSIVAAVDSNGWQWPDSALRVIYLDANGQQHWDLDESHYYAPDLAVDDSLGVAETGMDSVYNIGARIWVNEVGADSMRFAAPVSDEGFDFDYTLLVSYPPPTIDLHIDTTYTGDGEMVVTVNGSVGDFLKSIRTVERFDTATGTVDTLLKQSMRLRLYLTRKGPAPADSTNEYAYLPSFIEIPPEQFDNWDQAMDTLSGGPGTLMVNDLVWNAGLTPPGAYGLAAAVEVIDFVYEDGDGHRTIMPDSMEDSLGAYHDTPVELARENDSLPLSFLIDRSSLPLSPVGGLSATGSPVDSQESWDGVDQTRSIFLRWEPDSSPALAGYEIAWYPAGHGHDPLMRRSVRVGATGRHRIRIPAVNTDEWVYYCDSAKGAVEYDSIADTIIAVIEPCKMCTDSFGSAFDKAFYEAETFDVVVTPLESRLVRDTARDYRGLTSAEVGDRPVWIKKLVRRDSLATLIEGVSLGRSLGSTDRNDLTIALYDGDEPVGEGQVLDAPLNESRSITARVGIAERMWGDADASNYGLLHAALTETPGAVPGAYPSFGAGPAWFAADRDTFATTVSFSPSTDSLTCAAMFYATCIKDSVDSTGSVDTLHPVNTCLKTMPCCDCDSMNCDPNYAGNLLPTSTPCNGNPDSLMRRPSPLGEYAVRLYAVNNGRRGPAVPDSGLGRPAIYRTIRYRITPPRPLLRGVHPKYLLGDRNDTIEVAASGLWNLDGPDRPTAVLRYYYQGSWQTVSGGIGELQFVPTDSSGNAMATEIGSNADYIVRIPVDSTAITLQDTATLYVSLVNHGEDNATGEELSTASEEIDLVYIHNARAELECPPITPVDTLANVDYLMEFIGVYPNPIRIDPGDSTRNDTVLFYFSEVYDLDRRKYSVVIKEIEGSDTIDVASIQDFAVMEHGIEVKAPGTLSPNCTYRIVANYTDTISPCHNREWGKNIDVETTNKPRYEIVPDAGGFRILPKGYPDTQPGVTDRAWYVIGGRHERYPHESWTEQKLNPEPGLVAMNRTNYVVARITDNDIDNAERFAAWVRIPNRIDLLLPDDQVVDAPFEAAPGLRLRIRTYSGHRISRGTPATFRYAYAFAAGDTIEGTTITFTAESRSPLTVMRTAFAYDTTGRQISIPDGDTTYDFTLTAPDSLEPITIPASNLQAAATGPVDGYPLLLRLDDGVVDGWDLAETAGFHFAGADLTPLPFEVEELNWGARTMTVWVRVPRLDPGVGNNTIYFVPGDSIGPAPEQVWDGYAAVWHGATDTTIPDASGNGRWVDPGSYVAAPAVTGAGMLASTGSAAVVGGPLPLGIEDNGLTVSGWVRIDHMGDLDSAGSRLWAYRAGGGDEGWAAVYPDGRVAFGVSAGAIATPPRCVEAGTWLHVACTYRHLRSPGDARIVINGVPVAEGAINGGEQLRFPGGGAFYAAGGADAAFPGTLDEIRVAGDEHALDRIRLDYVTQRRRNDFLTVPRGIHAVTALSRPGLHLRAGARPGDPLFAGTASYTAADLHARLRGRTWLTMPMSMASLTGDSAFSCTINGPADVAVLCDARFDPPAFLADYDPSGDTTIVIDSASRSYRFAVYEKRIETAGTVWFGGPGADDGVNLPYAVLIGLGRTAAVGVGVPPYMRAMPLAGDTALLFADREYEVHGLPAPLDSAVMVRTLNGFKAERAREYLRLTIDRRAEVTVLADSAYAVSPFRYADGWRRDEHLRIASDAGTLVAYRRTFADSLVTLPGPAAYGATGHDAAYGVLVSPARSRPLVVDPASGEGVGVPVSVGMTLHPDTTWRLSALASPLLGTTLIPTMQSDYAGDNPALLSVEFTRDVMVYVALDTAQHHLPSFMAYDSSTGAWTGTEYAAYTDAPAAYRVYRRFYRAGEAVFGGPRSGDETANRYMYLLMVKPYTPDSGTITMLSPDPIRPGVRVGDSAYADAPVVMEAIPEWLAKSIEVEQSMYLDTCRDIVLASETPVRVVVGIDATIDPTTTFLRREGYRATGDAVHLSDGLPRLLLWSREFDEGRIVIPGLHCDQTHRGALNYKVFLQPLPFAAEGLRVSNLAVRGMGGAREARTASGSYTVRDLDVAFAYGLGLSSRSWHMNVSVRGGRVFADDTAAVLSPFVDTVLSLYDSLGTDTGTVVVSDSFDLPDLLPVLVDAEGVTVSAKDLSARGVVRLWFMNRGDAAVDDQFAVVLFEDLDGDFSYGHGIDRYYGRALVEGIGPSEILVYEIEVDHTISFPEKTFLAFVDAEHWIEEYDENNNVEASDGVCAGYERPWYVCDSAEAVDSTVAAAIPLGADRVVCRLVDTDGDSVVSCDDSAFVVYVDGAALIGRNAWSGDTLFGPVSVNALALTDLLVDDLSGDGTPEVVVGNLVVSPEGDTLWDATAMTALPCSANAGTRVSCLPLSADTCLCPVVDYRLSSVDLNRDGDADSIAIVDSCVTVRSGRDGDLLFVYPMERWPNPLDAVTVGVLSRAEQGSHTCYDLSASFPRYSLVGSFTDSAGAVFDTVELTVRVANGGSADVGEPVSVAVYGVDSTGVAEMVASGITTLTPAIGEYEDVSLRLVLTDGTRAAFYRLVVDHTGRWVECEENNNGSVLDIME